MNLLSLTKVKSSPAGPATRSVAVVNPQVLVGEVFATALQRADATMQYRFHPDLAALRHSSEPGPATLLVSAPVFLAANAGEIASETAVVVLSDDDSPAFVFECLERGARGCVPMSMPLTLLVHIIHLVMVGGSFVPPSALKRTVLSAELRPASPSAKAALSSKEALVARELSTGKPNKQIAYRLNMTESTVKVHVRSIMRKLGAKNRTQVVAMINPQISAGMFSARLDGNDRPM